MVPGEPTEAGAPRGGVYRFDRFTLDLVRGAPTAAGGTEVALRPKAFSLLARLVENAGRLVDRDEIMRAVWPGVTVGDDSITQCVREIRRALCDEDQRLLRTLPRRGFLFAAEVSRPDATTGTRVAVPARAVDGGTGEPSAAAPSHPAAAGRPVVVVLPFEAIGGDPEATACAEGLTSDLATDLTRFGWLVVVRPRGAGSPAAAGYVVGGGVRRAAGLVRVTARLEDAETGAQVWSERFDRSLGGETISAPEEVSGHLAARLVAQVEQETRRRAMRRSPAALAAYELCLRGRELRARSSRPTPCSRGLLVAAIILWNTRYLGAAFDTLRTRGVAVPSDLVRHVAPLGWEHVGLTGDYVWVADTQPAPGVLRPLRDRPSMLAA